MMEAGVTEPPSDPEASERELVEAYLAAADDLDRLERERARLDAAKAAHTFADPEIPASIGTALWTRAEAVRSRIEAVAPRL